MPNWVNNPSFENPIDHLVQQFVHQDTITCSLGIATTTSYVNIGHQQTGAGWGWPCPYAGRMSLVGWRAGSSIVTAAGAIEIHAYVSDVHQPSWVLGTFSIDAFGTPVFGTSECSSLAVTFQPGDWITLRISFLSFVGTLSRSWYSLVLDYDV